MVACFSNIVISASKYAERISKWDENWDSENRDIKPYGISGFVRVPAFTVDADAGQIMLAADYSCLMNIKSAPGCIAGLSQ